MELFVLFLLIVAVGSTLAVVAGAKSIRDASRYLDERSQRDRRAAEPPSITVVREEAEDGVVPDGDIFPQGQEEIPCGVCSTPTYRGDRDTYHCKEHQKELMNWLRGFRRARPTHLDWLKREDRRCYLCGGLPNKANPFQIEHVYPRSRGGKDIVPNVGFACRSCNASKGDRLVEMSIEQEGRWEGQQENLARRYATLKPQLPFAVRQEVTFKVVGEWVYRGRAAQLDPYDLALVIVETLYLPLWNNDREDPPDSMFLDFPIRCREALNDLLPLYLDRGWLVSPYDSRDLDGILSSALDDYGRKDAEDGWQRLERFRDLDPTG